MTKAVAYYRVSTDRQAGEDHHSLPAQRSAFEQLCTDRGFESVGEYQDVDRGKKIAREAYQRMLDAARRHEFDVIVVSFLDRFGRDKWEVMARLGELRSLGVDVESIHDDTREFIMVALSAWKSDEETKRLGERVRAAGQQAQRDGYALGVAPYGYLKVDRHLVPDARTAPIVRSIFEIYASGAMSLQQLAVDLNTRDVPRPRARQGWQASRLSELLRRTVYKGVAHWGGVTVEDAHPAIVPVELWEAARRRAALKNTMPAGQTFTSNNLLVGIVYCGLCQGRMLGHTRRIKGMQYRYYHCSNYKRFGSCEVNSHVAGDTEDAVLRDLDEWAGALQVREQKASDEAARYRDELAIMNRNLEEMPARFSRTMDQFERGIFASEEQQRLANQRLDAELHRLELERERLQDAIERAALSIYRIERRDPFRPFSAELLDKPMAEQKAALQELVERVTLTRGEVQVTLREA